MNRILFSLLFLSALLNAESQSDEPVSLTGAGPSAFIHNVNAITGDLVEVVDILEFKGTMPLKVQEVLTRFNAAPYKVDEKAHVKKHANNRVDCVYTNPGRLKAILSPEGRGLDWGEFRLNMELPENAGLTNQALGIVSGQSHPGNIVARVGKKADEAEILCGDGTRKIFRKGFSSRKKESVEYDFHHEIRPDGLYFGKRWDTLDGFECRARGEKLWGMVTGGWAQSTKHPGYRKYIADDGRETVLETTCFWDGDPQPWNEWTKWYPTKVIPHNDCPTEYSWINKEGYKYAFLVRKKRADDRLRTFSYDGVNAEIRDKHSKYRTRTIVDHAAWRKQVVRAKFDYDKKGSTWVEDGRGYFRRFNYDQEGYLTGKYWFLNPGDRERLLAKESFTWIKGGAFKGSLAEDAIYDGQNKLIKKTAYRYDKFGNVKTLTLSGAITAPLQKDEQKTFATYSNEGMNLLLSETTGAKRTEYRYKEGTNLLTAKYTVISGGIVERNFYFYNEKSALIGEINDDGVTEESSCLEGVTTRLIKRMQTFESGLPHEIAEYYLDLNSGEEKLLKRVEYELTREGWIKKESIFDADNIFRYCIERKFNAQGKVVWESDALGNKIRHTYLKSGAKIETRTAGVVINYTYDHADRLLSESTDGQYVNTYEVDDCDNRILARDLYGNETRFKYDALGRVVEEILPQIELPEGAFTPVIKKKYDLFGNVTRLRNSRGFLTEKTYNIFGKPFSIHYPDGSFEEFRYNLDGTEKSHRLRTGATFHYSYDALGRKTREELVGPEGELLSTETIEYDRLHMRRKVDSEGVATTYDYDFAGRLCREECCGRITEYGYDTLGRKTWTKIGQRCTFEVFDDLDRVIEERIEDCEGNVESKIQYRYDAAGNRTHEIVGESVTETRYDALKRPVEIISPEGLVTHISYETTQNSLGQNVLLKVTTAPSGTLTLETHDALGRVVACEKVSSLGESLSKTHLFYDAEGNLVERRDDAIAEGTVLHTSVVKWDYNSLNQPVLLVEAPGTPLQRTTHMSYTLFGEKECVIKPDGTKIRYSYNALGLLEEQRAGDEIAYRYSYDRCGRLVQVLDLLTGEIIRREYDPLGNLAIESLPNGSRFHAKYDELGRVIGLAFGMEARVSYTYSASQLKSVSCAAFGTDYKTTFDQYDLRGNLLKKTLPKNAGTVEYAYDLEGRVTSIVHPKWEETEIAYDLGGNLIAKRLSIEGDERKSAYTYDPLDQLTGEEGHAYRYDSLHNRLSKDETAYTSNCLNQIGSVGDELFSYDSCGNLIRRGKTRYRYDPLDRLIAIESPDFTVHYTYDAFGRRLTSTENGVTTRYLYHGKLEIGSTENFTMKDFRVLGQGLGAEIGASTLFIHRGKVTVPLHDSQGSVRALLTPSGALAATYKYSAYGECSLPAHPNRWLFASKRLSHGLYNFGLRSYAPDLGRWITTDPKSYQEGPNLYAYVSSRPLALLDEFGESGRDLRCFSAFEHLAKSFCYMAIRQAGSHEDAQEYLNNYKGSGVHDLGYHQNADYGIGFINGINTSYEECRAHAEMLSKYADGYNVNFVYNQTHSPLIDMVECGLGKLGIATSPVKELHKMWDQFFENSSPDGKFLMFCHSQGVIHVLNALLSYPKEVRDRIIVRCIAPPSYIGDHLCSSVRHYRVASGKDIVPVTGFFGYLSNQHTTTILPSLAENSYFDHSFNSPTYSESIMFEISKFLGGVF